MMAATGLPLALLTIASLVLAGVYVCNSFILDAWTRYEWNRLDDLRQRLRKARVHQIFAQNRLTKCNETLSVLQLAAGQLERRAKTSSERGVLA